MFTKAMKTREQIEAMSDEERRIKTAELCFPEFPVFKQGNELRHQYPENRTGPVYSYPTDLNAMHGAELWLKERNDFLYGEFCDLLYDNGGYSATARQRNTAFLMVML